MLTILTVYAVARRLFPLRPGLAVGAAALVALLPEAQYLAGGINDDNLAWLAGALLVLAGVIVMQSKEVTPWLTLGVGFAVALAVLAKETVWVLAVLLIVLVVVRHGRALRAVHVAALLCRRSCLRDGRSCATPSPSAARCLRCIRSRPSARC